MTAKCKDCDDNLTKKVEEFCLKANKPMRCYKCQQEEKEGSPKPFLKTAPSPDIAPNKDNLIIRQTCIKATGTLLQGKPFNEDMAIGYCDLFYNWVTKNGNK